MTNEIKIRKATKEDMEGLLLFEQGVISAERPFDSTLKNGPIRYYDLQKMITDQQVELVVAEHGAKLIGSGYARIERARPIFKHEQYAYLGFMYVHPDFRGQGVNGKIMEALKAWAKKQGLTEMRLDVYHGNERAIRAYEKTGFEKHMIQMRIGI